MHVDFSVSVLSHSPPSCLLPFSLNRFKLIFITIYYHQPFTLQPQSLDRLAWYGKPGQADHVSMSGSVSLFLLKISPTAAVDGVFTDVNLSVFLKRHWNNCAYERKPTLTSFLIFKILKLSIIS